VAGGVGNTAVCEWLLKQGANSEMRDRWGCIPNISGQWYASGQLSPGADE
jgi:hypothetical protein